MSEKEGVHVHLDANVGTCINILNKAYLITISHLRGHNPRFLQCVFLAVHNYKFTSAFEVQSLTKGVTCFVHQSP